MKGGNRAVAGRYLALAGGVVRVLRPTLADYRFGCVAVAASMRCLAGCRVGNREWGLRPQTPPPTKMGMLALWLFIPRQTRCWAGGLGVRAQAPFALATETARRYGVDERIPVCQQLRARAWAGERIPGPPAPPRSQRTMSQLSPAADQKPRIRKRLNPCTAPPSPPAPPV